MIGYFRKAIAAKRPAILNESKRLTATVALGTAFAPGHLGWRIVEIRAVKWSAAATVATALEKLSVHVGNFPRTRLLVKVVYVLGADEEAILQSVLNFREGEVRRVRFGRRSHTPPHRVELPHQPGIAMASGEATSSIR